MPPVNPVEKLKTCPFCAEKIQEAAIKCRFCSSMLTEPPPPPPPGLFRLIVANLLCPGLGAWKLGHRLRGFVILMVILIACTLWLQDAMARAGKIAQKAMKTRNTKTLEKDMESLKENPWYDVAFWAYLLSFADLFWLVYVAGPSPQPPPDKKPAPPT